MNGDRVVFESDGTITLGRGLEEMDVEGKKAESSKEKKAGYKVVGAKSETKSKEPKTASKGLDLSALKKLGTPTNNVPTTERKKIEKATPINADTEPLAENTDVLSEKETVPDSSNKKEKPERAESVPVVEEMTDSVQEENVKAAEEESKGIDLLDLEKTKNNGTDTHTVKQSVEGTTSGVGARKGITIPQQTSVQPAQKSATVMQTEGSEPTFSLVSYVELTQLLGISDDELATWSKKYFISKVKNTSSPHFIKKSKEETPSKWAEDPGLMFYGSECEQQVVHVAIGVGKTIAGFSLNTKTGAIFATPDIVKVKGTLAYLMGEPCMLFSRKDKDVVILV